MHASSRTRTTNLVLVASIALVGCGTTTPGLPTSSTVGTEEVASNAPAQAQPSSTPALPSPQPAASDGPSLAALRDTPLTGRSFRVLETLATTSAFVRSAIEYESDGLSISGELFVPVGDGPFPLVLTAHGYIDPEVYTRGRGLRREQAELARRGFAVLHPDYRGHGLSDGAPNDGAIYEGALGYSTDLANAIVAIRAAKLDRVDAARIGILGHSMSGGIAMNVAATHPELVDALVLYAPVHADAWENYQRWRADGPNGARTLEILGTRAENPERWDALSVSTMLDAIDAPITVFHGTSDRDVPYAWSTQLVAAVEAHGTAPIRLVTYEGEGHEFGPKWNAFIAETATFFRDTLRPARSTE